MCEAKTPAPPLPGDWMLYERETLLNPSGMRSPLRLCDDAPAAKEDFTRQGASVVFARHGEPIGTGVEDRDILGHLCAHRMLAEVVGAFTDRTHYADLFETHSFTMD
jgi:hypothetical protein